MTDVTPEQLLREIENSINAIDFCPDYEPARRSDSEALRATWCCPFTDEEISAIVEWHTGSNSISDWLERNRDYTPDEGDNWSDEDWAEAKDSMCEDAEERLLIDLRFDVSNHLRRMLGMVENKEPWADSDSDQTTLFN